MKASSSEAVRVVSSLSWIRFSKASAPIRSADSPVTVSFSVPGEPSGSTEAPAVVSTAVSSAPRAHQDAEAGAACREVPDRLGGDESAPADDDELVGGVFHVRHEVAGEEDRTALTREAPEEAAHPEHAFRVHAVDRFVEHQHRRITEQRDGDPEPLLHAEREAADAARRGRTNTEIAEDLFITVATAKSHVSRLLTKLGARDPVQLVITAYEMGLVTLPG